MELCVGGRESGEREGKGGEGGDGSKQRMAWLCVALEGEGGNCLQIGQQVEKL